MIRSLRSLAPSPRQFQSLSPPHLVKATDLTLPVPSTHHQLPTFSQRTSPRSRDLLRIAQGRATEYTKPVILKEQAYKPKYNSRRSRSVYLIAYRYEGKKWEEWMSRYRMKNIFGRDITVKHIEAWRGPTTIRKVKKVPKDLGAELLSEYERARLAQIQENQELLEQLGF